MKILILITVFSMSLISIRSNADRFPIGDPGDECRSGIPGAEDCGEGMTCEVVGYEEDLELPRHGYPIYGCVEEETYILSLLNEMSP